MKPTGCPERLRLMTLLRISVRHWFTARWVPAAANDDFDSGVPA